MNDFSSSSSKSLKISFDIPSDMCDLDEDEIECIPDAGYKKQMMSKEVVLLTN